MKFLLGLKLFASKKGVGTTNNGFDSHSKRLGMKKADGETVKAGAIIYRQRGTKIHSGKNVSRGGDDTLCSLINGIIKFEKFKRNKIKVSVYQKK